MRINVNAQKNAGNYVDQTCWQNTTLRYSPPADFPKHLAENIGRAKIMRVFITLDEYWEISDDTYFEDYEIGKARVDAKDRYFRYDWWGVVPAPSGTRFEDYIRSHAAVSDELLLNVRRLEREVSDGIITYEKYAEVFTNAVEYCKRLAPNIRYIECCNEVDLYSFGNLTAEEYVRIYLVAHRAIKEINERNNYDIPLEIGGYGAAFPISRWTRFCDVMKMLRDSDIGEDPMDFYSYHHYEVANMPDMLKFGMFEIAEMSAIDKIKLIIDQHNTLRTELGLPDRPVFFNEMGREKCTDVATSCLHNAAGLLTYLIYFAKNGNNNVYPFPWCTFHNPSYQISYTQFVLNEDGSYSATPNGIAIMMMHRMRGELLDVELEKAYGRDPEYRAIAVKDGEKTYVLCANPTGEIIPCRLTVSGLDDGKYAVSQYLCDDKFNNCVTGKGNGRLEVTKSEELGASEGNITLDFILERDNFILIEIERS